MAKLISKTYGEALFQLAMEEGRLDQIASEVAFVRQALLENQEPVQLLDHPKISRDEKVSVIENIFKGRISDDVTGLLVIMIEKNRQNDFINIFDYFESQVREYKNIGVANVASALPLTEEQCERIVLKLIETTQYSSFEMNYKVDMSLIGGIVIRIGDCVIDSSIKSKLERMTRSLQKASVI